jgi:uncharacterized membrane protein
LALILLLGIALRAYQLGGLSFWYDEVVTMRLAEAATPRLLLEQLSRIDATRAPLHPLLLHYWLPVFGRSEASARSLSALAGVLTIALVFGIGRSAFDTATGLWAAWLAAISPILIVYAREARMYALLVLLSCACWYLLLEFRRLRTRGLAFGYGVALVALVYTHPLGVLMAATLAIAALATDSGAARDRLRWIIVHGGVFLAVLPWIGHYFDHRPEFLSGRLPIKFLLGTPIGFIGGDSRMLIAIVIVIASGVVRFVLVREPGGGLRLDHQRCARVGILFLWLVLPPVVLYVYSLIGEPIFGPARYTVFVGPAYLVLVAAGLRYIPPRFRYPVALTLSILAGISIWPTAYAPDLKANWRAFSQAIAKIALEFPNTPPIVIVASSDSGNNVEVETARYYLPTYCEVIADEEFKPGQLREVDTDTWFFAVGARDRDAAAHAPEWLGAKRLVVGMRYPGLVVYVPGY